MKKIIHNAISINGGVTGFEADIELYYRIAGSFGADAHLIGSNTARTGIDMFGSEIPEETEKDFQKPDKNPGLPLWAIPDSTGKLEGLLHVYRNYPYCKDVVVFVSENTPGSYIEYLKQRNYDHYIAGAEKANLAKICEIIEEEYDITTLLTDGGSILTSEMLNAGLVDQVSLIISPNISPGGSKIIFGGCKESVNLNLISHEIHSGRAHLLYSVVGD